MRKEKLFAVLKANGTFLRHVNYQEARQMSRSGAVAFCTDRAAVQYPHNPLLHIHSGQSASPGPALMTRYVAARKGDISDKETIEAIDIWHNQNKASRPDGE